MGARHCSNRAYSPPVCDCEITQAAKVLPALLQFGVEFSGPAITANAVPKVKAAMVVKLINCRFIILSFNFL